MRIPGLWRSKMALRKFRMAREHARALRAVAGFPQIETRKPHGLQRPLIVTLTSYPPRFPHLGKTLRSLLDQTIAADRTILWIAHKDMDAVPEDVLALRDHGLEIVACKDLRSYKKLIPALHEDPDRYFVTADDDVYYPPHWLAGLVQTSQQHPADVCAHRARVFSKHDGSPAPYRTWPVTDGVRTQDLADKVILPTGRGGVLYPPNCFLDDVVQEDMFMALAEHGDDLWFFWMARLAGHHQRRTDSAIELLDWPSSQEVGLYQENLLNDRNDGQIAALRQRFGDVA